MAIRDPFRNFKFRVEVGGVEIGFRMVSGLKETTEIIEYREGGENETPRKIPGQTTFENVTLERGLCASGVDLLNWRQQIFSLDNPVTEHPPATDGASNLDFRRDVVIYLKNKSGEEVHQWTVIRAWPSEMEVGDLDASSNEVLVEKLVLANEGIKSVRLAPGIGGPLT